MSKHPELTPEAAERLTVDAEPWLSCDDCFNLLDQYVDQVVRGAELDAPAMRAHLIGCSACHEEARSLLLLVATEDGVDPESALQRLLRP